MVANALAYFDTELITAVKSFIVQAPEQTDLKLTLLQLFQSKSCQLEMLQNFVFCVFVCGTNQASLIFASTTVA